MMREDMGLIQKEQGELEKRKTELERQLAQRQLTESQEARIRSFAKKISSGLDNLDFAGRQELTRLLIEKVLFDGQVVEIQTIITPDEQLHPVHRGGLRGIYSSFFFFPLPSQGRGTEGEDFIKIISPSPASIPPGEGDQGGEVTTHSLTSS